MRGNKNSKSALIKSSVVPFFPGFRDAGLGGFVVAVSAELVAEENESAEEAVVVSVGKVLGDSFEGDDEAEGLENKPCISKRRRTFHIV